MTFKIKQIEKIALTEEEAAAYICMSRSFLAKSRMEGKREGRTPAPPFIKIGRAVRYLREDLEQWLYSQQRLEHLGQLIEEKPNNDVIPPNDQRFSGQFTIGHSQR